MWVRVLVAAYAISEVAVGKGDAAMAVAQDFLAAVEEHDLDRAWSLVYPPNRAGRFGDDPVTFDALVGQIDLATIDW